MRRVLLGLLALALAASVLLLPESDAARLGAHECGSVLREDVDGDEPGVRAPLSLGNEILRSPAVLERGEERAKLSIFGVRYGSTDRTNDPNVHDLARRSLCAELRALAFEMGFSLEIEGERAPTTTGQENGLSFLVVLNGDKLTVEASHPSGWRRSATYDGWRSARRAALAPVVLAIAFALLLRAPLTGLLVGLLAASILVFDSGIDWRAGHHAWAPSDLFSRVTGLLASETSLLVGLSAGALVLATIGVMSATGGLDGLAQAAARFARGARSTQVLAWIAGVAALGEDHVRRLAVGGVLRPISDRAKLSREKLAYLVDTCALPLVSLAVFGSLAAWELFRVAPQLPSMGASAHEGAAIARELLPLRFYCVFSLVLAAAVALTGRDFGPMLRAERRARTSGKLETEGARSWLPPSPNSSPARVWCALAPLAVLLYTAVVSLPSLYGDGEIGPIGGAALALASSVVCAFVVGVGWRMPRVIGTSLVRTWRPAALFVLSVTLAVLSERLGAARYFTDLLGDAIAPRTLPCALFLMAAGVAFALGNSLSATALLLPPFVGLAFALGERDAELGGRALTLLSISAVLEGALCGRHASPLASTSIAASAATSCDHADHVRTQLPYALLAAACAVGLGFFPCAMLGWSPALALGVGVAALVMVLAVFGRKSEANAAN